MNAVNIGILGPGNIARKFADACARVPQANLMAVASRNQERADQFAKEFNIPKSYGSYEALLADEEINAVYISVVNSAHLDMIVMAANAGKAILCEKPCVSTQEEADVLYKAVKENDVLFMEGVWPLYVPGALKAKEWLKTGKIGTPQWIDVTFSYRTQDFTNHVFKEGALVDSGVYAIALAQFMAESELLDVSCSLQMGEHGVDEYGSTSLKFANGILADCHFGITVKRRQNVTIWGTEGHIELEKLGDFQRIFYYDANFELAETFVSEFENGFVYEITELCELFAAGKKESNVIPLSSSMKHIEVYEKARRSAH